MTIRSFLYDHPWAFKIWNVVADIFAAIHWPRLQALWNGGLYYSLQEQDLDKIRYLLKENYVVILTRRRCHLTTYVIGLLTYIATKKAAHYTHALMNVEGDIANNIDFKLIEATAPGVHYSSFMEVFDCDSIVLLKPRDVSLEEWTLVLDAVKEEYGHAYDTLFDLTQDVKVSCVEMVYQGLKKLPDWQNRYRDLISLIETHGNGLTPQMMYDCGDMDILLEVRR